MDIPGGLGNIGIGTDIEAVSRFEKDRVRDARFLARVYTERELEYCYRHKFAAQHLAARFCAKEACIKALGCFTNRSIDLNHVEIVPDEDGCPHVILHSPHFAEFEVKVSMSHGADQAMAVALAARRESVR